MEVSIHPRTRRVDAGLALIEIWVIEPPSVTARHGDKVVDPLHLALSYSDEKRYFDERVSLELGNMLEELGYEFEDRWA